jgi:anaerobic ribonucleoside-triphosphate reductase activating protein
VSGRIRVCDILEESFADGPGIRFVVFAQGCPHRCPGCHNPKTHPFTGGHLLSAGEILRRMARNPMLDGITLSGGEPFEQALPFALLAGRARRRGYHVMTYTGYTWEQITEGLNGDNGWRELLESTDVLVDGPFIREQRTLELPWRGSRNQRLIDVPRSLTERKLALWDQTGFLSFSEVEPY